MNLELIYQNDQAIIKPLKLENFPDDLGLEICEYWLDIKKLININWKYYISEINSNYNLQILVSWICDQYLYFNSLSTEERMIVEDKIIGIFDSKMSNKLENIITNSPELPVSLVVQTFQELKENILTNIDPIKTLSKMTDKIFNFIQLVKGTHCLLTFPTLDILIPKHTNLYHIENKPIDLIYENQKMEINTGFYINLLDLDLIEKFCDNKEAEVFNLFSEDIKNLWKIICNWCLKNKKGDLDLSKKILHYL